MMGESIVKMQRIKSRRNLWKIFDLLEANRDLPVVFKIDNNVTLESNNNWNLGKCEDCYIGECMIVDGKVCENREVFKKIYYKKYYDEICKEFKNQADNELEEYLNTQANYFFTKSIIVVIEKCEDSTILSI